MSSDDAYDLAAQYLAEAEKAAFAIESAATDSLRATWLRVANSYMALAHGVLTSGGAAD